jgi:hypothetical protein
MNIINIGLRYLALTIRNLNYTLNFFLYSLTSVVFLKEAFTIARCNYFISQNFVDRNPSFRGLRRLFALPDEHREQQPINLLPSQELSTNNNYQSCSNGHIRSKSNVSINLQQLTIKPKQKKLKWNLKPMNKSLSANHIPYQDDDDDEQQQQLQLSSAYTSTSNINENRKNSE